jgi:hypothetical protein
MLMVDSVNAMPKALAALAVGVEHAGVAGRRDGHRHGHVLADHGGARGPPFHVHRHALAQENVLEISFVGAVGALGP